MKKIKIDTSVAQRRVNYLHAIYGSWRAAAAAIRIRNHTTLWEISTGRVKNLRGSTLACLGLRKMISYEEAE